MRQRFLIHPDATITQGECEGYTLIDIDNRGACARLTAQLQQEQKLVIGEGFFSEVYNVYKKCPVVDIMTEESLGGTITTVLTLGKVL
jgi:hypothetical protein